MEHESIEMSSDEESRRSLLVRGNGHVSTRQGPANTTAPSDKLQELCELLQTDPTRFEEVLDGALRSEHPLDLNEQLEKWTLLQHACHHREQGAVRVLLELGADVTKATQDADSPVYLAARMGDTSIMEMLAEKTGGRFKQEESLLHVLVTSNIDTEEYLSYFRKMMKEHKELLSATDKEGRTPLHYALMQENKDMAMELLNHGADIYIKDKSNQTPLDYISREIFQTFLDSKVSASGAPNGKDYRIYLDYTNLLQSIENGYRFPLSLLKMVKHADQLRTLLSHPMLSYIIFLKWRMAVYFAVIQAVVYCFFTVFISVYLLLVAADQGLLPVTFVFFLLSCISFGVLVVFELCHLFSFPAMYKQSLDAIVRVIVFLTCAFSLALNCHQKPSSVSEASDSFQYCQYYFCPHVSAFAILFAWLQVFFMIGKLPQLTFYIKIFRKAFVLLVKFATIHLPMIVGFALSFNVMFSGADPKKNSFVNVTSALLKTSVMLTGEFEAGDIPFGFIPFTSHLIFLVFVGTISIVLFNLLIGLATTATQNIECCYFQHDCSAEVWLITCFEETFSSKTRYATLLKLLHQYIFGKVEQTFNGTGKFQVTLKPNECNKIENSFIFSHDNESLVGKPHHRELKVSKEIVKGAIEIIARKKALGEQDMLKRLDDKIDQLAAAVGALVREGRSRAPSSAGQAVPSTSCEELH